MELWQSWTGLPKRPIWILNTFHFCLAKNFFILSLERFLEAPGSADSNVAIQEWDRASLQDIRRLCTERTECFRVCTHAYVRVCVCKRLRCPSNLTSFCRRELMKSLACFVISSKLSSSNSQWAAVTKARVSESLSPWNGDSPLKLYTHIQIKTIRIVISLELLSSCNHDRNH